MQLCFRNFANFRKILKAFRALVLSCTRRYVITYNNTKVIASAPVQTYHNTLCFSLQNFAYALFPISAFNDWETQLKSLSPKNA